MAQKRVHSYARTYSYGAQAYVALPGALASHRPMEPERLRTARVQRRGDKRRGRQMEWRLPMWCVVLGVAGAIFALSFVLLGVRSDAAQVAKQISGLHAELGKKQEVIASLEVQLAEADDPQRIHSIAVNRLKMRRPEADQIRVMPRPYVAPSYSHSATAEEEGGVFRFLLSLVGL